MIQACALGVAFNLTYGGRRSERMSVRAGVLYTCLYPLSLLSQVATGKRNERKQQSRDLREHCCAHVIKKKKKSKQLYYTSLSRAVRILRISAGGIACRLERARPRRCSFLDGIIRGLTSPKLFARAGPTTNRQPIAHWWRRVRLARAVSDERAAAIAAVEGRLLSCRIGRSRE